MHASAGALCDRLPLDLTIKLGRKGVDEAQAKPTFAGRPHPAPVILDPVEREQCASVGLNLDGDLVGRTSDATRLKAPSARWYSCNRFSSGDGPLLFFVITMGHNPASRAKFHTTKM